MQKLVTGGILSATLLLAACGQTVGEQALLGAGVGAVGSAAVGGNALTGAVVGGAANTLFCQANPGRCR